MEKDKSLEDDIRAAFVRASKKEKYKMLLKGWGKGLLISYKNLPKDFYNSEEWAKKRIEILKRDNFKCIHCGNPANHVDHINSAYYFPKLALNSDNLISSCEICHKKRQSRGKWK